MPSRLHAVYARLVPRMRKAGEMTGDEPAERARVEAWHRTLDRSLPTSAVPRFARHWSVVTEEVAGFPAYVLTPRGRAPTRTVFYLHGGGFMAPISAWQVRYAARLADAIGARVVLPDYPLTPEHSWRDSFGPITDLAARWAAEPGGIVLAGDSSGGGYALAVGLALRDRGGPQPTHLVLHAPWIDLTTSTPETDAYDEVDPWLFKGKMRTYAQWWAGSPDDLGRPEVSPGLGDLSGLPPALMFYGTRDLLAPGCRLLVRRAAAAGWDLTAVEDAGPDPRVPVAAVPPRGADGVQADGRVPAMTVRVLTFDELDAHTAYDVWRLRQQVFVVEQQSPYPDLDGRDREPTTRHLLSEADDTLVAYARVLDDGEWARIGRVLVAPEARGRGLAAELVRTALEVIGDREVRLDAQTGLRDWYASYGFVVTGPEFDEDGVIHVPMRRPRA